jgi:hypothetical protein
VTAPPLCFRRHIYHELHRSVRYFNRCKRHNRLPLEIIIPVRAFTPWTAPISATVKLCLR